MKSSLSLIICCAFLFATSLGYYPKWKMTRTEATIGWDVSGYYFYLPAIFIYHDLKHLEFRDEILRKYYPTPDLQQAYLYRNGNYVMKYSAGMALQYLPFFLVAHAYASASTNVEVDGFSWPYQLAINIGSLLIACIGLYFLRRILLRYFEDVFVAIVLLILVLGTNYLDYAAINGAMSHNYLFTLYAILIFSVIEYYTQPSPGFALLSGCVLGLMILTRPTEMLAGMIPLLWGVNNGAEWNNRTQIWRLHRKHVFLFLGGMLAVGSIQIMYWLYVTGSPLVYSYQDQGFRFFKPFIISGMFSYRSGWLVYSPALMLALAGIWWLWKQQREMRLIITVFMLLFIWITWSWVGWTYGGELGQRAMVQSYVVLAFPLCALIVWIGNRSALVKTVFVVFILGCSVYNLWLTHHAHKGGLLRPGEMTKAYFWKIFGRMQVPETAQFLLDTDEQYSDETRNADTLFVRDFNDLLPVCKLPTIEMSGCICVPPGSDDIVLARSIVSLPPGKWLRAIADFQIEHREWDTWRQGEFTIELLNNNDIVKSRHIRPMRILQHKDRKRISVDLRVPDKKFDALVIQYKNQETTVPVMIDDLVVIAFDDE